MDNISRKVEKRNRPPVSCEPCRTRKLKCNRALPCDSCVKRNTAVVCRYAANASRGAAGSIPSKRRDFKDRLDSLESLVSSFISNEVAAEIKTNPDRSHSSDRTAEAGSETLAPETPHLQESDDGPVNYIDPSHWQSILEDIREVREHLSPSMGVPSDNPPVSLRTEQDSETSLLFGRASSVSIDDILLSLPAQPICDMLLSFYFGSRFMVLGIIHPAKFQNEYKLFWESPSTAPPLWTALLFSILSITTSLRQIANPATAKDDKSPSPRKLQEATANCLLLGSYATGNAFALEAFLFHLQSCFLSAHRPTLDLWFGMGTIIQLAFRMGYHRDPSALGGFSPFDGEMRRRLWLNIVQIDALMSFQVGFPSMISSQFCDTRDPRNLEYSDLQVGMAKLPSSRPFSDHTPVLYTIVKSSIMSVFKRIVQHTQMLVAAPYNVTLALEAEMRHAYSNLPETYQRRDVNRCFTDPSGLILERCTIEILYLKGLIILLRRFISYDLKDAIYNASRRACVDAALEILARQVDINKACDFGGRLHEDRWMFLSLPAHDYILAAMVVCLDLSVHLRSGDMSSVRHPELRENIDREYKALQTAYNTWGLQTSPSREVRIAAEAIELMIRKVAEKDDGSFSDRSVPFLDMGTDGDIELPYAGTMSQMIDGSETIDWNLLDQYFQGLDGSHVDAGP